MHLPVIGICLLLATGNEATKLPGPVFIPADKFTLAWTHSIEKVRWEEDYRVRNKLQPVLEALTARVKGSASGMEPQPDSILRNGWYEYQPNRTPETPLRLTRSGFTPDYELCIQSSCKPMEYYLPTDGGVTLLYPCTKADAEATN